MKKPESPRESETPPDPARKAMKYTALPVEPGELSAGAEPEQEMLPQVQRDHRRSYEELLDLFQEAPVGYLILDLAGTSLKVNRAAAELLGAAPDSLVGLPLRQCFAEEEQERFALHLSRVASSSTVVSTDLRPRATPSRLLRLLSAPGTYGEGMGRTYKTVLADVTDVATLQEHLATEVEIHRRREWLFSALNRINDIIHGGSTFDEIMLGALPEAVAAVKCDTAAISLRMDHHWQVRYVHGLPKNAIGAMMSDDEERHAVLAIASRKPVLIGDTFVDPRLNQVHMRKWNIRAVIVVPLLESDRADGVMFLNFHAGPVLFDDLYADFATKLSSSLSLALFKAKTLGRLQRELEQRLRAEEELRESEERFRTMADSAPVMIWVHKTNGELTWVNEAWERFFGVKEADAQGPGRWQILVHPEDAEEYNKKFLAALAGRTRFDAEARVRHRSGEWRWVHSNGTPRFSATGEFLGMVGSSFDVTSQKQLERAIRREEENLRTMVEHSVEPMAVLGTNGEIETVSNAGLQLLGYEKEELIGRNVADMIEPISRVELAMRLKDMREHAPRATEATVRVRMKNGVAEWMLVEASLAARAAGAEKYLVKFLRLDYAQ